MVSEKLQRPGIPVGAEGISGSDGQRLLFAADGAGLFRSADDGETWSPVDIPVPSGSGITSIGSCSGDAGPPLLLAGLVGGIARSIDLGESWSVHPLPAPPPLVTSVRAAATPSGDTLAIAGTFEDGAYRSTDAGLSWRSANIGLFDHSIYAVAILPHAGLNESVVLIGTSSGVSLSENGGQSWLPLPFPDLDSPVLAVATMQAEAGGYRLFAGTESGELRSSHSREDDWERIALDLDLGAAVRMEIVGEASAVVAVFERGVAVSRDRGETWQTLPGGPARTGSHIVAAAVDTAGHGDIRLSLGHADGSWSSARILRQD